MRDKDLEGFGPVGTNGPAPTRVKDLPAQWRKTFAEHNGTRLLANQFAGQLETALAAESAEPIYESESKRVAALRQADLEREVDVCALHAGIDLFLDGNAWCATGPGHIDPQQSPAGFGDSKIAAIIDLARNAAIAAEEPRP